MSNRWVLVVLGLAFAVCVPACSTSHSGVTGAMCDESPPAATLMYPQPDTRNVTTSLSEIVLSGADLDASTKISLIDAGGQQIVIGPLKPAVRPADAPDGVVYESAEVKSLAPEMNYIVLYSPLSCAGEADYAIGSFTTK